MLEHMMFRGTEAVPDGMFDERADSLGVSINAATWLDYTFYTSTGPQSALPAMLALEADRFRSLALTDDAFYPERDVVANERRQVVDSNPDSRLGERLHSLAFAGSRYAWPTIGWAEDIANYSTQDLRDFYERGYIGPNILVVAVGKFDPDAIKEIVEHEFTSIRSGIPETHAPPAQRGAADETMDLPVAAHRLLLAWPAPPRTDRDFPAWVLFDELLAAAESSVLPQRLEHSDRTAVDVSSALHVLRDESSLEVEVTLRREAKPEAVTAAILDEIAQLAASVDEGRLAAAKVRIHTGLASGLAETASRAEIVGESWATCGATTTLLRLVEDVREVRPEDVQSVAGALLASPHVRLIGVPV
ncbi:MAG: zinc protease [Bradymonadia bacterium]|jgi:zinc protease